MRVGLFSPMGTGNLGDASTQDAVILNLRKRLPGIEIYGFSLNAEDTASRHKIPSFPISLIHWNKDSSQSTKTSPLQDKLNNNKFVQLFRRLLLRIPQEIIFNLQAFRRVRRLNLVIFSGSGQLADEWSKIDKHPYTILRWTLLATLVGIPVVFISVGAGPLTSSLNRRFIKWALSMARYRSFRDDESRQYMARIGFDRSDPVVPDLAHSLPELERLRDRTAEGDRLVVGISPMAYCVPQRWYKQDTTVYDAYVDKLADFIGWLMENQIKVDCFPTAVPSDSYVIEDLKKLIKQKFGIMLNDEYPPVMTVSDLLSRIAGVDVVVASRFHGILLPFVLYKPVIALSYHPKDSSLMQDMAQTDYCLDIESFKVQSLKDCFQSIRRNLDTVRTQIIKRETEYRKLLDRQYDIVVNHLNLK